MFFDKSRMVLQLRRSFPMIQLFTSGGQSIRASASILPVSIQDWFPLGLTDLIFLQSRGRSRVFSSTTVWKHQQAFFIVQFSHLYMTIGKTIALTMQTFIGKVIFLLFNTPFRFVIAFLPRSKHFLISWLWSPSTVILEPKKIKSVTVSTFPPIYLPLSDGTRCQDLSFLNVEF